MDEIGINHTSESKSTDRFRIKRMKRRNDY
jgi:hypothetical protein